MTNLDNIANVLREGGLTVVEMDGWVTRGFAAQDLIEVRGVLYHHTATNRAAFGSNDAPTLNMCINGRSDLAGPLCNLVLGRSGTVYVVATGVANHAGSGVAANIPRDMGNHYMIGIEMESSGVAPADWTQEQLDAVPKIGAALERGYLMNQPPELRIQLGHKEYSDAGKIDPSFWPGDMDGLRDSINAVLNGAAPTPAPVPDVHPVFTAPPTPITPSGFVPDVHWEVDPGDSLAAIAQTWGTDLQGLANYNGINLQTQVLEVGEWIWPPTGYGTWTIDSGDTLSSITAWCQANWNVHITMEGIQNANGINDANVLPPIGHRLQIV